MLICSDVISASILKGPVKQQLEFKNLGLGSATALDLLYQMTHACAKPPVQRAAAQFQVQLSFRLWGGQTVSLLLPCVLRLCAEAVQRALCRYSSKFCCELSGGQTGNLLLPCVLRLSLVQCLLEWSGSTPLLMRCVLRPSLLAQCMLAVQASVQGGGCMQQLGS